MAMDLDDGGVDHGVFHVRRVGAGLEKPCKNARLDPVAVALENSVPVAEERRKITPRASRPHDPKDSFHKATVVASAAPGVRRLTQTMRLHLRPLGVRQYESFHLKLESQPSLKWNPDSQQALVDIGGKSAPIPVQSGGLPEQTRHCLKALTRLLGSARCCLLPKACSYLPKAADVADLGGRQKMRGPIALNG